MTRPLRDIAADVRASWPRPYYAAAPYLDAMASLGAVTDMYGADDGRTIVLYFLSNATTWRGPRARELKAELRAMVGLGR